MGLGRRFNETVELAKELGLYNSTVFFDLSWVPYERVKDYMLEADLSVCTYFDNLETHFSLRTRFVDVFWAELPLVCTQGDVFADIVRERSLGITVPQQDAPAVAAAIERLLDDREFYDACKRNIREANKDMSWNVMLEPIVEFCRNPRSSALPKWRRSVLAVGAWAQWAVASAAGMLARA
jgi:glycosyltransferase involved in cell wall biosynthesis